MIQFSTLTDTNALKMAYNNDVARFFSDIAGALPLYCDVTATDINIRLYPAPDNTFYFNFRQYVSALINTRNFEDTLETSITSMVPESFIYDASEGAFLFKQVTFKIRLSNNTDDTSIKTMYWIAGVQQLGDHATYSRTGIYVLSPFIKETTNKYYLKYWQGYPFDISFFFIPTRTLRIKNLTNLLTAQFTGTGYVKRLFLSDGRTDVTLEEELPLVEGYNELRIMQNVSPSASQDKFITLEKVPYKCGVYLKWLNSFGGYSYWLFEHTYSIDRNSKQLGELDRDTFNRADTFTRAIQIGKESQDTIRVVADLLTQDERDVLESIFDSPKIYLFTGAPYSQNDARDWVEISMKTTNGRIKNAKEQMTNFVIDFELPQRYTQTL